MTDDAKQRIQLFFLTAARLKSSIIQVHHALCANSPPLHPLLNFYPLFTSLRDNFSDSFSVWDKDRIVELCFMTS